MLTRANGSRNRRPRMFRFVRAVTARRFVRKMRGGAQAHLLEAEDGQYYVVKFLNNPQGRRVLVNELVAHTLLRGLGLTVPDCALVDITEEFLRASPEVHITLNERRVRIEPGWHFGSRYPGDPNRVAVYDFLPDAILGQVINVREFLGVLVADKWLANTDGRQCIFHRARVQEGALPPQVGFVVQMIDHGFALGGPDWHLLESPIQGLYPRRVAYESVRSQDDFQPWLDQVGQVSKEVLEWAFHQVPPEWLADGEGREVKRLIERLLVRAKRVPDLIDDARRCSTRPFPNWP